MSRPMEHPWTILVPLDGSSFSEAILGTAERLARPLHARVVLLIVADPALEPDRPLPDVRSPACVTAGGGHSPYSTPRPALEDPKVERRAPLPRVEDVLRGYLRRCAAEFAGVETRLVVDVADDPADVIVTQARREHADLIAMATHGRTGLLQHLTGGVAERVVRSGVAPVVVLRP